MSLLDSDRRGFFKILGATAAATAATGCGSKSDALIPLLVPEHNIPVGEEQWHPAVCTECSAGCGTLVRVMGAERVIDMQGEKVRQRIAAVKKIEGNPLDRVSGGRLCARGQATVQALYHPDRLHEPMKRSGDRGKANFTAVKWQDAVGAISDKIRAADPSRVVFLTGPNQGSRAIGINAFLKAIKAQPASVCSLTDFASEFKAARAFGWDGLPQYDVANATHIFSVGADFLGGWISPVYYARQFGQFRQGRIGVRGTLFHAESRFSNTAMAADKWLPILPGTEPQFIALAAKILLDAKLVPNAAAAPAAFRSADVASLLKACGLDEHRTAPAIREFGSSKSPLMLAGASQVHSNSVDAILASHYFNFMMGVAGKPSHAPGNGGADLNARLANAQIVLVEGTNPAYTHPHLMPAISRAEMIVSFAPILDDTAAWADYILPDNHPLESALAVSPIVSDREGLALAESFLMQLYTTQPVEQTLSQIAPAYKPASLAEIAAPLLKSATYEDAARQGGIWLEPDAKTKPIAPPKSGDVSLASAHFEGDGPLYFQPYLSAKFGDGSASHLPWLQELPDPVSSAIWSVPVEIDPKAAAKLGIRDGDRVRVESPRGSIEAPAFINPAAIPGVVSMAIGAGHTHYGRYASNGGANPLTIATPGAGTKIKLSRVSDEGNLIQFSTQKREKRNYAHR